MKRIRNLIGSFSSTQNERVLDLLSKRDNITISGAGNYSSKAFIFADALREMKGVNTILWVVNTTSEQEQAIRSLNLWADTDVYGFDILPPDLNNMRATEERNNMRTMEFASRLVSKKKKVIVAPYQDLLVGLPKRQELEEKTIRIKKDEKINVTDLFEALIANGYEVAEEKYLEKGSYYKSGEILRIFPINSDLPVKIEIAFDQVEKIFSYSLENGEKVKELNDIEVYPAKCESFNAHLSEYFDKKFLYVEDELDIIDEFYDEWNDLYKDVQEKTRTITFVSFNEDSGDHLHLHYISVLKYRGSYDLANDMRQKHTDGWKVMILTKNKEELANIFDDYRIPYKAGVEKGHLKSGIHIVEVDKEDVYVQAFQNPELSVIFMSDKEASTLKEEKEKPYAHKVFSDFLTSLKLNDYVVHANHGIGRYLGLEKRTVDNVTREYIKLGYAENDRLFVPIDQADKVNKFIGADEQPPKLTRLGSAEWNTITKKVQKETEKIAQELLKLYAERKSAKGFIFKGDPPTERIFDEKFPYEETPGQLKAINDVAEDMGSPIPMDRLVCGDVGFGKTEVAMRAAFKAVRSGKQVVVISPITILADQHYRSFRKRMDGFDVRVELLSRFRTPAEQKKIIQKLEKGEIDVVIGTHRLIQPDVDFKNLGLVVIDEEQRFGVKQKEVFKKLRAEVDVLTLTATPIPRTLNFALNKLRDISTITTPPPGRLPIITEVRKYSQGLIREAILRELDRGGQVYFLHNRVQTIDSVADKLRSLIPEARIGVAHGKLGSGDLEERVLAFKDHKFDVLVSSTIIENGIDLSNANTLIVNNAERLGLAQLYQLRGRVGRGKKQAYAYFLYHGQRLKLDAKKRLRAIVEASELGSGFQIAMKDLEIRGAGDILGAKQHGVINVVGVSHFIRMLNKAVDDLKAGKVMQAEEPAEVSIELPLTAYIPDSYIVSPKDKINTYQKMSAADNMDYLKEIKDEIIEEHGKMPNEVINLFRILELKVYSKQAKLINIKVETVDLGKGKEVVLHISNQVKPENIMNLLEYNSNWRISGTRLRVRIEHLGMHWLDELIESVKKLSGSIKKK